MFNKDKILEQDYCTGKRALLLFVQQTQTLYGIEMMKYNVHLLTQIPRSVKDFGALWAWSAFPYENYNRVLRQILRCSQAISQQICKSYLRLKPMSNNDIFNSEDCNVDAKKFFDKMVGTYGKKTGRLIVTYNNNNFIAFGRQKKITLTVSEKLVIEGKYKIILKRLHSSMKGSCTITRFIMDVTTTECTNKTIVLL